MSEHLILQKVELLFQQSRYEEAKNLLGDYLTKHPTDFRARLYFISTLLRTGENKEARQLCDSLVSEYPDSFQAIGLSIQIDLDDEYFEKADSKIQILKEMDPMNGDVFLLETRNFMGMRNYDKALAAANHALSLEPDSIQALNFKISLEGILGTAEDDEAVEHALNLDPENAYTIANHAHQLLKQGKPKEALERVSEALAKDPNNDLAQYVMSEALKSQFWVYRMFYKYSMFMSKMTANGSWAFIIGIWIAMQLIDKISESYPIFLPLIYILIGLVLLTWVVDSLFNLYLYFNKYGRLLLEEDDKNMALLVGGTLAIALTFLALYFATGNDHFTTCALVFGAFAIPLGTFLKPRKEKNRKQLKFFTAAIVGFGILGCASSFLFVTISLIGVFVFQWVVNSIMIKENARVI